MSLLLNEAHLASLPAAKKSGYIFNWLKSIEDGLPGADKKALAGCQKALQDQLNKHISESLGPASRTVLGRCFGLLYTVGNSMGLRSTVNLCHDILRNLKDDSASAVTGRLTAAECLGAIYEKLGRMAGPSFQESAQLLVKAAKQEASSKSEILQALERLVAGLSDGASAVHKDIYRLAKSSLTDKSMPVRFAAAKCLLELQRHAVFIHMSELDSVVSAAVRGFDGGTTYEVRCAIAQLLGGVLASTQKPLPPTPGSKPPKRATLDEVLGILSSAFVRGSGDLLKTSVSRELRVGVTQAYVVFLTELGPSVVERNITRILRSLLDLLCQPKAVGGIHVDAVYTRRCISFIFRSIFGRLLGESAQVQAARTICQEVVKLLSRDGDESGELSQHATCCAMQEIGGLVEGLSTLIAPLFTEGSDSFGVLGSALEKALVHPSRSAALAAAWCMRCTVVAMPSQLTPLVDHCLKQLSTPSPTPTGIYGYGHGLAALIGSTRLHCPLGIPQSKTKVVFEVAEELLRSSSQNTRLAMARTRSAWAIFGALMTLGPAFVRPILPRMTLLWRNAFPRSTKELETEKAKGDAFTWQVTLEGRAGALGAIQQFFQSCGELLSADVVPRIVSTLESALSIMSCLPGICKQHGLHLKAGVAMLRLRLYQALLQLKPKSFESMFGGLLRELVADFTLTANPANISSSLLRWFCHDDDSVLLGSWSEETDHKLLEDQLQTNSASGSGALEHDTSCLYWQDTKIGTTPGPLPLGVALIDSSVALFGKVFPKVAVKHGQQLFSHFGECIKQAKSVRQQCVQINIFTAFLAALRGLVEEKAGLGESEVIINTANQLILAALTSSDPILRCAAGEALGRLAQVIKDPKFMANTVQMCFERLKTARDVISRTGHSLVLGCLHRYTGGMSSGHHLATSVSILHALAQDASSPSVQVWALHALALIADTGGPLFRGYVQPTLTLVSDLLLTVPTSQMEVHKCLGRCLLALVTTLGPELMGASSSVAEMRSACLAGCQSLLSHPHALVRVAAIQCLQQLQLFSPAHVALPRLVPVLCDSLASQHLLLRRAAAACFRQLSQREAAEVLQCANAYGGGIIKRYSTAGCLEAVFLALLDVEVDIQLRSDLSDTFTSMLLALAPSQPRHWLMLCYSVLSASSASQAGGQMVATEKEDDDDEDAEAMVVSGQESTQVSVTLPCWTSKVFAIECVERMMKVCAQASGNHVDIAKAKQLKASEQGDFLVLYVLELVRTVFMASTGAVNKLRIVGLQALMNVIGMFADVPDPDYTGHALLEQYQAQISAALRPAFADDIPPDVTAKACQVCSMWLSCGVCRSLADLRHVQTLMVSSLSKVRTRRDEALAGDSSEKATSVRYNESTATMEKLAVLKAWAEVYIKARQVAASAGDNAPAVDEFGDPVSPTTPDLVQLVAPELHQLRRHWLVALRDHAMLELPAQFQPQLPPDGGAFYSSATAETASIYYKQSWPPLLLAAAYWMNSEDLSEIDELSEKSTPMSPGSAISSGSTSQDRLDRFRLVLGLAVKALCVSGSEQPPDSQQNCVEALLQLFTCAWPCQRLSHDYSMLIELLSVLHRVLLTAEVNTQQTAMQVVTLILSAYKQHLSKLRSDGEQTTGEGGDDGNIQPGRSVVFVAMEVCLTAVVRAFPMLSPQHVNSSSVDDNTRAMQRAATISPAVANLSSSAASVLAMLPDLCNPAANVKILPTLLFLLTGMTAEASLLVNGQPRLPSVLSACLQALQRISSSSLANDNSVEHDWQSLLASGMLSLLEVAEEGAGTHDMSSLMLALAVFVQSAPAAVVRNPSLEDRSVAVFKKSLTNGSHAVQLKAVQCLQSIVQRASRTTAAPYIQELGVQIMEKLHSAAQQRPGTEEETAVLTSCIRCLEALLEISEETHRVTMVAIVVPLLVDLLLDSPSSANHPSRSLHDFALQQLMQVGPKYPGAFKTVVATKPELKSRLEAAIRAGSNKTAQAAKKTTVSTVSTASAPSIKLKMSFGKF